MPAVVEVEKYSPKELSEKIYGIFKVKKKCSVEAPERLGNYEYWTFFFSRIYEEHNDS